MDGVSCDSLDISRGCEPPVAKKKRKSSLYVKKKKVKTTKSDEYEVETIIDHKIEEGHEYYLVKWKGWAEEYDSWVPKEDLFCPGLVEDYHSRNSSPDGRIVSATDNNSNVTEVQNYIESIWNPSHEDIQLTLKSVCNPQQKGSSVKSRMSEDDLNKYALNIYKRKQKIIQMEKNLVMQVMLHDFQKRRNAQLMALKRWEDEINAVTESKPSIRVENDADLEEPPNGFTYVNQCKAGEGVEIPDDPVIGCECADCSDGRGCCGPMSGSQSVYKKGGRLKVPVGTPIYECNKRCKCTMDCPNRVVQRGSKLKLCIFRTGNGRGWGLKTVEAIKKNSFVIEYVGEVITNEEAEKRGVQYDAAGRTYLFDLDFNDIECTYSVDAAVYGNCSHFINHSCDPNLAVFAVFANCLDPNMPRLALFAQRDISVGEELTFDYASSKTGSETSVNADGEIAPQNECRCGAATCRKIMFSLPKEQAIPSFQTVQQTD